jgi:hypothetical protein
MPEKLEEWLAFVSFILVLVSALTETIPLMMMSCVWCIGYCLISMRRSND